MAKGGYSYMGVTMSSYHSMSVQYIPPFFIFLCLHFLYFIIFITLFPPLAVTDTPETACFNILNCHSMLSHQRLSLTLFSGVIMWYPDDDFPSPGQSADLPKLGCFVQGQQIQQAGD
jgi:hypothetical protein